MKNLVNLCWVVVLVALVGLACSGDEPKTSKPNIQKYDSPTPTSPSPEVTNTANTNMSNTPDNNKASAVDKSNFHSVLDYTLNKRNLKKSDICDESNPVQKRILEEYGAVFLTTAIPPSACMFTSESQVNAFHKQVSTRTETIGGAVIQLQADAMTALLSAADEAKSQNLKITPRDGAEAAKRGFDDTLRLWKSRFEPACEHWKGKGKLTDEQVNRLKSLPINDQVREVLELEKGGIYFNTFFNATILSSVAAPGTSQHLSMLAFDANEFESKKVQEILGNHGWFRTVKGDAPHFTYLGVKKEDLPNMGLHIAETKDGEFWVPKV